MKLRSLTHKWVGEIPPAADLAPGILYVSLDDSVAIHSCCCGCGVEVVTPLHPTDWMLTFDGETVSLRPSIGNWNLQCQSHYFITNGEIEWASTWCRSRILQEQERDQGVKQKFFAPNELHEQENKKTKTSCNAVVKWFGNLWGNLR
ncbi:MAG: DUF6527 family protein [Akkermansiaceae bacterium]